MSKALKSSRVNLKVECIGPNGQDFRIETYKLNNIYYLETSRVLSNGVREGYKTQWIDSKHEMIKLRCLAYDYLHDKGIW